MDILPLLAIFISWTETPLGIAIVASLAASSLIACFVALRRYVRSIPRRFQRWLDRKQGRLL